MWDLRVHHEAANGANRACSQDPLRFWSRHKTNAQFFLVNSNGDVPWWWSRARPT